MAADHVVERGQIVGVLVEARHDRGEARIDRGVTRAAGDPLGQILERLAHEGVARAVLVELAEGREVAAAAGRDQVACLGVPDEAAQGCLAGHAGLGTVDGDRLATEIELVTHAG
jgi:hypothetical protein